MTSERMVQEELVLTAERGMQDYWRDLWHFRELFFFMAWRDLAVRYKQTVIGVAWSVIRPVLIMVVFTVVFGRLAHLPHSNSPYAILVFAGLLPWTFFSTAVTEGSTSLIANTNVISKVYFPRLVLPTASIIVALVDFAISLAILVVLMLALRFPPDWHMLALPLFLLQIFVVSLGAGWWLAALNVKYRDFRYIVPFLLMLGLYISPVGFSSQLVPERWQILYYLNPMVGPIDGFRWAILGHATPLNWWHLGISALTGLGLLAGGLRYFMKTERSFADVI